MLHFMTATNMSKECCSGRLLFCRNPPRDNCQLGQKNTALVDLYVNPIPDLVFLHDEVMGAYREIPLKTPSGTKTSDVIDSITKPNSSSIFGNRNMWRKPLWKRLYFSLASHLFMWGVVGFNSCSATVYIIQWVALKWKPVGSPTVQDSTCMPTVRGLTQNTRSKAL